MAACKSCGRQVSWWRALCDDCFSADAARQNGERSDFVTALAAKATGRAVSELRLFGVGYWDAANHQTVARDIGQAFLSGAFGMAAPFLVKGKDYTGHVALVAITRDRLAFVDFGLAPLGGVDLDNLAITDEHLRALLASDTDCPSRIVDLSGIKADYVGKKLTVTGDLQCSIILPVSGVLAATATAQHFAYAINGTSEFIAPLDLLNHLLIDEAPPSLSELSAMAASESYMQELFTRFAELGCRSKEVLIRRFQSFPDRFKDHTSEMLRRGSQGADRAPLGGWALLGLGIVGIAYGVSRFIWLFQHDDELVEGSFEASGLLEIGTLMLSVGLIKSGVKAWNKHQERRWYRAQLDVFHT